MRLIYEHRTENAVSILKFFTNILQAGGATMGEVRGAVNGVDTSQEAGTSGAPVQRQQQRQFINGSLSDHAGRQFEVEFIWLKSNLIINLRFRVFLCTQCL